MIMEARRGRTEIVARVRASSAEKDSGRINSKFCEPFGHWLAQRKKSVKEYHEFWPNK
jgi:hypothetical protein